MNFLSKDWNLYCIIILYSNQGKREPYNKNNNSFVVSEVAASNMTSVPQEFDASGIPSLQPNLDSFLETGAAEHVKVKWGKSERYVIIIGGKKVSI